MRFYACVLVAVVLISVCLGTNMSAAQASKEIRLTRDIKVISSAGARALADACIAWAERNNTIVAMAILEGAKGKKKIKDKTGRLVASFPVEENDQIMLVTDGGKLIRTAVDGIRIAGRSTQGVIVFHTAEDEKVVSVERLSEEDSSDE